MDRLRQIIFDIYVELYENSIPRGDFKVMYENAITLPNGNKDIPTSQYTIDSDLMDNIIKQHLISNDLDASTRKIILMEMYCGYSPLRSFKENERY